MSVISTLINKEEKRKRPNVGDCIDDKYDVIRELGEGGFGAVLEVVDRATKQNYAIKVCTYSIMYSFYCRKRNRQLCFR